MKQENSNKKNIKPTKKSSLVEGTKIPVEKFAAALKEKKSSKDLDQSKSKTLGPKKKVTIKKNVKKAPKKIAKKGLFLKFRLVKKLLGITKSKKQKKLKGKKRPKKRVTTSVNKFTAKNKGTIDFSTTNEKKITAKSPTQNSKPMKLPSNMAQKMALKQAITKKIERHTFEINGRLKGKGATLKGGISKTQRAARKATSSLTPKR